MQAGSMAQPMSIEEVKAMLDTTEKGGVRNSIKNCLTVFQHDPLLSGAIAYNLLTDRTDIVKPIGYDRSPGTSMTDTDMKYIRLYLEENYDLTSEKKIMDAADLAAHQNSYHPVRDFLNSLTWDGTERIPTLFQSLKQPYPGPGLSEQSCMGRNRTYPLLSAPLSRRGSGCVYLSGITAVPAGCDSSGISSRLQI